MPAAISSQSSASIRRVLRVFPFCSPSARFRSLAARSRHVWTSASGMGRPCLLHYNQSDIGQLPERSMFQKGKNIDPALATVDPVSRTRRNRHRYRRVQEKHFLPRMSEDQIEEGNELSAGHLATGHGEVLVNAPRPEPAGVAADFPGRTGDVRSQQIWRHPARRTLYFSLYRVCVRHLCSCKQTFAQWYCRDGKQRTSRERQVASRRHASLTRDTQMLTGRKPR
jgi:hypothetical protein